ncbi:MAG TPA: hypothetical protein VLK85_00885, partial [Ramlibacter sp.]|nr:hypothetical protein [Ramlibacter sp.]
ITRPAALVVGNPVFEAYALHAARARGIPTVLLQHGLLGDFCQFSDPPVDHYVVRGEFWRDFLAAAPRSRAQVLEPPRQSPAAARHANRGKAILFLTAPYGSQPFYHPNDLADILRTLLTAAAAGNRELIIRVHPQEDVGFYQRLVKRLGEACARPSRVTYSRGAGLEATLGRTAVAVTFASTVFLDCLRLHIPIVSFGWHHFAYKRPIEAHGVFHFAEDLAGLSALVHRAVRGELPPYSQDTKPFLADTPETTLRSKLARLVRAPEAQPT